MPEACPVHVFPMETRLVGANGFTKEELDELFGKAEQAVQQNKTAQP